MNEMNGKFVGRKPLFVEERKAQLQAHFAEIVAPGGLASPAAGIHAYYSLNLKFKIFMMICVIAFTNISIESR
ncbi:hypothetical protein P8452_75145 [Trifolium repens]|nr:polyadenylate-binding protein [Trifolium repens]WJX93645.1 hypothetical protein P8452_75145 [Trifolium repens]